MASHSKMIFNQAEEIHNLKRENEQLKNNLKDSQQQFQEKISQLHVAAYSDDFIDDMLEVPTPGKSISSTLPDTQDDLLHTNDSPCTSETAKKRKPDNF